jgi:hypothetical protein
MRINPENINLWSNTYFHPENENICMKDWIWNPLCCHGYNFKLKL